MGGVHLDTGLLATLELSHDARTLSHGGQHAAYHGSIIALDDSRLQAAPVLVQPRHCRIYAALYSHRALHIS